MASVARVELNEVDITPFCVEGSVTKRLNGVGTASVKVNMQSGVTDAVGALLKIYLNDGGGEVLHHHGRTLLREVTAGDDGGYAVYNSSDPLELWSKRPVRDPDGDFSKPSIITDFVTAPQIVEAMFNDSESAGGGPPTDAEGPLRMALGSVATGTVDVSGTPVDWPMTMSELLSLLVSTGVLDAVVTPIELDGNSNYGQLDLYNGNYGTDRTASVTLSYGMGAFNVQSLRWNTDMSGMCNKLWYYLGPRVQTQNDPAGDQHWQANITGDDPGLTYPPGGALSPPASATNNQIGVQDASSRTTYDVRMDIRIFDGNGEVAVPRELWRRLWQTEQWLRAQPQELIHVTPARDQEIGTFDIGDLITVEAVSDVMGGFSGAQRVYSWTASWDADESVVALGEIQVSPDNEGLL